jgi:anti-sigma B factor antagonist
MIQVSEEIRGEWRIVTIAGRADGESAEALETALRTAVEANPKVVADFSGLTYISSASLRSVLQGARAAQTRGTEFAICGMHPFVKDVFETTGLHKLLRIYGELPC